MSRVVYGLASVSTVKGKPYVDSQGDYLPTSELVAVAHRFMAGPAHAGVMHMRDANGGVVKIGRVVSSIVLTKRLQTALGISLPYEGWLVGIEVDHPEALKLLKDGTLADLSIAGRGVRTPVELES